MNKKLLKQLKADHSEWPTFADVKGYKDEVARLKSIAAAVKLICAGKTKVGELPKGIMLSGEPGMGKTTMMKAMVSETDLPCIILPEAVGPQQIFDAYKVAAEVAPCFLFIDDVDRIVTNESPNGFESDESRLNLKALITCLDGITPMSGIVTLMTTNDYGGLDSALTRSGRTDLHIPLNNPSDEDRAEILQFYMDKYDGFFPKMASLIAKKTRFLSCAGLKTIINDVWIQTVAEMGEGAKTDEQSLVRAFQRRAMELVSGGGMLKEEKMNDEDKKRLCYHEAGHAVVIYVLEHKPSDICTLQSVNLSALGWTMERDDDLSKASDTLEGLRNKLASVFAGMAATDLTFHEHDTGGFGDIEDATRIVSLMFASGLFGLDLIPVGGVMAFEDSFLSSVFPEQAQPAEMREKKAQMQKDEFNKAYQKACEVLTTKEGSGLLKELAETLYENGIVSAENMEAIAKKYYGKSSKKPAKKKKGE